MVILLQAMFRTNNHLLFLMTILNLQDALLIRDPHQKVSFILKVHGNTFAVGAGEILVQKV
jgi:hypothetical protein